MARQDHSEITDDRLDEFLDGLAEGKSVLEAAGDQAFRRRLYRLRAHDSAEGREFARRWKDAYDEGTDLLEKEAQRRAVEGVDEPRMLGSGDTAQLVQVRKYSDTLLIFLLKARRPEKYRDNAKVEITGHDGGPIEIEHRGVKLADVLGVARTAGLESGD